MIPKRHPDTTRWLGAPKGWEPATHGSCSHLAVTDIETPSGPAMRSRWEPTPDELAILNAGGSVELQILGCVHPPVSIVAVPAEDSEPEAPAAC
ncbi:MAG: hypothetical protein VYD90_13175 [Pseudomonadota bacterium]|nr:hypothetical protein [Pseudomonadota bacterium]